MAPFESINTFLLQIVGHCFIQGSVKSDPQPNKLVDQSRGHESDDIIVPSSDWVVVLMLQPVCFISNDREDCGIVESIIVTEANLVAGCLDFI